MGQAKKRTVNRSDFVRDVARATNLYQRDVKAVMRAYEAAIARNLVAGNSVTLSNFGKFRAARQAPRMVRDPQTGRKFLFPARRLVRFRAADSLRKRVRESVGE